MSDLVLLPLARLEVFGVTSLQPGDFALRALPNWVQNAEWLAA